MKMMHALRRWCLLFVAITTAAFAAPGFAKSYKVEVLNAQLQPTAVVPNGTNPIILKVYNTSTEPATINSLVICKIDGITLTSAVAGSGSGTLATYVPSGGDVNVCISPTNPTGAGWSVTSFTGFKRLTNKIFKFNAIVNGTCGDPVEWPMFASTGNTFSTTDHFFQDAKTYVAVGCDAVLACSPPGSYTETSGGNTTTITRIEKSGFPCDPKSFNVLFSNGNNTVELKWVGLGVVLRTEVDWPPTLANALTTQAPTTWVAWEQDGNGPKYIPVPACKIDQPSTPVVVADLFPVFNNAKVASPVQNADGSYSYVDNPYYGQRTKICATEETYSVLGSSDLEFASCPVQSVLGCVLRHSILYASDDIFISNQ